MDLQLAGRRALITGSGKGIGKGIALSLAREGVRVAVHYNSNKEIALQTLKEVADAGPAEPILLSGNLTQPETADRLVKEAAEAMGGLDILVNNAALQTNRDLINYNQDAFRLIMDTNFMGYQRCIRAAVPYLKQSDAGRIIVISSVHGKRPTDFDPVYSMSKAAIKMLVRESAIELAQYGITVNLLAPAAVQIEFKTKSEYISDWGHVEMRALKRRYKPYPLGRVGIPEDMGYACCFLASPLSCFHSGAALRQDGAAMLL